MVFQKLNKSIYSILEQTREVVLHIAMMNMRLKKNQQ